MNLAIFEEIGYWLTFVYPPEWVRAALVLALTSTGVVIGLFTYLNHNSKKRYFGKWTTAWLFYGVFLLAAIGLENSPDQTFLVLARRACVGISALYLFYGSLDFARRSRPDRELLSGVLMLVAWSGVAAYQLPDTLWATLPVFVLLGSASLYTGSLYFKLRRKYRSSSVLACGFVFWGFHLAGFPFFGVWPGLDAGLYLLSALIALMIAMAMMVQMIEEAREHNESLVNEYQKELAQCRVLEQEVTQTEQRYRALFEASTDAMFLVDLEDQRVVEVNQSAYRLFSRNGGALVGAVFADVCPGLQPIGRGLIEDRNRYVEFFRMDRDIQVFRTDGSSLDARGEAKLVSCNKRPMMQVSLHEVFEHEKIEQQLRKAEKLSALGTLIAGVAHELNNPLAVIMGYSQLLSERGEVSDKTRAELKKILHESERAAKIVRNLLAFARPRDPEMTVIDVNTLVSGVAESFDRHASAHDVQVEKRLATDMPRTKADSNQIEQVMANLISNAIQAMNGPESDPRVLRLTTSVTGAFIRITVEDTGPGIPTEVISRIFEPFYTTKAPGKGTGLGLSICQTILEEHHGKIWVQSHASQGAKFFVELPVVACVDETEPSAIDGMGDASGDGLGVKWRGGRRILVVDDEVGIVEVLKEALSYQGYTIDTAASGKEGLERLAHDRYDLIVSDLKMPELDGEKMYHIICKTNPELASRIIFLTGDTVSHKARSFLESTGNQWFSKPFRVSELEEVIDNYLCDAPAPTGEDAAEIVDPVAAG